MAPFSPILTAADVARRIVLGTTVESECIEFKREVVAGAAAGDVRNAPGREIARDICGLANALGGTIIVGVDESAGRAEEYRRAVAFQSVIDPEVVRAWLDSAAVRGHLSPSTLTYDVLPITLADGTTVIAINVPPCADLAMVWHGGADRWIEVPNRTSYGKKYLNPDGVRERIEDMGRANEIRLRALVSDVKDVFIQSVVKIQRPETEAERKVRLANLQDLGLLDHRSAAQQETTWTRQTFVHAKVSDTAEGHFELRLDSGKEVRVPYGAIAEVWRYNVSSTGIILRYAIAIPMATVSPAFLDAQDLL